LKLKQLETKSEESQMELFRSGVHNSSGYAGKTFANFGPHHDKGIAHIIKTNFFTTHHIKQQLTFTKTCVRRWTAE